MFLLLLFMPCSVCLSDNNPLGDRGFLSGVCEGWEQYFPPGSLRAGVLLAPRLSVGMAVFLSF